MTHDEVFGKGINILQERSDVFKLLVKKLGVITFKRSSTNFEAFVKIIISQKLSAKAAETIFQRLYTISLKQRTGLNPKDFIQTNDQKLRHCGLSQLKARYIKNIARKFMVDPYFYDEWESLSDAAAKHEIKKLDGFGEWSAEIAMLFNLGRLNIFPKNDATLIKAHKILFNCSLSDSLKEIDWAKPYKGVLALYYWRWVDRGMMELGLNTKSN